MISSPFLVPVSAFAVVALIVAITQLARIREKEIKVHQELYREEMEHQRKMKELAIELERIRKEQGEP